MARLTSGSVAPYGTALCVARDRRRVHARGECVPLRELLTATATARHPRGDPALRRVQWNVRVAGRRAGRPGALTDGPRVLTVSRNCVRLSGNPRNRSTSVPSSERARRTAAESGSRGTTVGRPPGSPQVATTRPSTSATGRKIPLVVTTPLWRPTMASRETQPCSNGSKAPSRRGGGIGVSASAPGVMSPSSTDTYSSSTAANPSRASRRVIPAHLARSSGRPGACPAR